MISNDDVVKLKEIAQMAKAVCAATAAIAIASGQDPVLGAYAAGFTTTAVLGTYALGSLRKASSTAKVLTPGHTGMRKARHGAEQAQVVRGRQMVKALETSEALSTAKEKIRQVRGARNLQRRIGRRIGEPHQQILTKQLGLKGEAVLKDSGARTRHTELYGAKATEELRKTAAARPRATATKPRAR